MKTINDIIENVNEDNVPLYGTCIQLKRLGMSDEGCQYIQKLINDTKFSKDRGIDGQELAMAIFYAFKALTNE